MKRKNFVLIISTAFVMLFFCGFTFAAYNGLITLEWNKEQFDVEPLWNTATLEYDFHISRNNIAKISNNGDTDANVTLTFNPANDIAAAAFFKLTNQTTVDSIEVYLPAWQYCEVAVYIAALPDMNIDTNSNFSLGTITMNTTGSGIQMQVLEEFAPKAEEDTIVEEIENEEESAEGEIEEDEIEEDEIEEDETDEDIEKSETDEEMESENVEEAEEFETEGDDKAEESEDEESDTDESGNTEETEDEELETAHSENVEETKTEDNSETEEPDLSETDAATETDGSSDATMPTKPERSVNVEQPLESTEQDQRGEYFG